MSVSPGAAARRARRGRPGLALPAAMLALTIVALFIAGTAYVSRQEAMAAVGVLAQRQALEAAEYGAAAALRDWQRAWNTGMPIGGTVTLPYALAGGASAAVRLTRVTATTWWVVSAGTAGGPGARRTAARTVNAVLRLDPGAGPIEAAFAAADSVRVTGSGRVIGTDSIEAIPGCGAIASPVAGVASPDTTRTCDGSCGSPAGGIAGVPRLLADSTVAARVAAALAMPHDVALPAGAVVTPAPAATAGVCDTLAPLNWGDPAGGPCAARFPVIRAFGDVTMQGGVGQGILLASGDVRLEGGALFAGLIVAGDDLLTGAGGAVVLGAALAGDARRGDGDHSRVGDQGIVHRSSCRLRQARLAAAWPARTRDRWWGAFD